MRSIMLTNIACVYMCIMWSMEIHTFNNIQCEEEMERLIYGNPC